MELALLAPGTTEAGENEHFRLLGSPEQVSATELSNEPDCGVTFTVSLPELPIAIVIPDGLVPIVSPELVLPVVVHPRVTLTAEDIWLVMLGFPTACTYTV